MTMGSNVHVFDVSIRHQQTALILVVLIALRRPIELLLQQLAIVRMNTLQEETYRGLGRFIKSHDPIGFFRPEELPGGDLAGKTSRAAQPLGLGQISLAPLERALGPLQILDVVAHTIPSDHLAVLVAERDAAHPMPAIFAVGSPQALLHLKRPPAR